MTKSLTNRLYLKKQLYQLRMNSDTMIGNNMDLFNLIVIYIQAITLKIEDEDQVLMLLCSLSDSHENSIDTILYRRSSITFEDIKVVLNSKELKKRGIEGLSGAGEGFLTRGNSKKGHMSRGRSILKSHGRLTC